MYRPRLLRVAPPTKPAGTCAPWRASRHNQAHWTKATEQHSSQLPKISETSGSDVFRRFQTHSDLCRRVRTPDSRCLLLTFIPSPAFPLTARICLHILRGFPSASPHSLVAGHSEWYCLIWPHELPTSTVDTQPACANGGLGAVRLGSPRTTETNNVEIEQSWPADMTERSRTTFSLIGARASRLSDAADKWGSSDVVPPSKDGSPSRSCSTPQLFMYARGR